MVKYKFIGEDNSFCLELVAYNIKGKHGNYLFKGDIITIPEDKNGIVRAFEESPVFIKVNEDSKKVVKKQKKEDKK